MVSGASAAGVGAEGRWPGRGEREMPMNFRTENSFSLSSWGSLDRVRVGSWFSEDILLLTELSLEVDAF